MDYYIAPDNISLLQQAFGVATSPEVMAVVTIITIIGFVGIFYLGLGFIVFLFFKR